MYNGVFSVSPVGNEIVITVSRSLSAEEQLFVWETRKTGGFIRFRSMSGAWECYVETCCKDVGYAKLPCLLMLNATTVSLA